MTSLLGVRPHRQVKLRLSIVVGAVYGELIDLQGGGGQRETSEMLQPIAGWHASYLDKLLVKFRQEVIGQWRDLHHGPAVS